ncbi:MAG TPA: hypothetical protein VGZ25_05360, partial [Gemmataceae bacterium]|nr:hypothetical protein [Gemmataceae bacterium]
LVFLARKDTILALADLLKAIELKPTPVKQFHLAQAYLDANNSQKAKEAWSEATKDDPDLKGIHPKERAALLSFKEEMKKE